MQPLSTSSNSLQDGLSDLPKSGWGVVLHFLSSFEKKKNDIWLILKEKIYIYKPKIAVLSRNVSKHNTSILDFFKQEVNCSNTENKAC